MPTDITIQRQQPMRPTWPVLSPELRRLLLGDADLGEITANLSLAHELRSNLGALKALATEPATPEEIIKELALKFAVFPQPQRSEGEWKTWWATYTEALAGLSLVSIQTAMADYVRHGGSEFFPKPGRIWSLAKTKPSDAAKAYGRGRQAVALADRAQRALQIDVGPEAVGRLLRETGSALARPRHAPSPLDRHMVRDMARAFADSVEAERAARPKPPERPAIHGAMDATGLITQAMRDKLRRDAGDNPEDIWPS